MKTTSKCQITLPLRLRMEAGIKPNEEVETFIIEHGGRSVIAVAPASNTSKGEALAARWVGTLGQGATSDQLLREMRGHE